MLKFPLFAGISKYDFGVGVGTNVCIEHLYL